jgi:flagellar biosynthesis protein FlhG
VKPLSQQDHYEMLEIPPTASPEDVERAYRMACATYADGSLAGHSVFREGDVEVIRERIEVAYRTLRVPEQREAYDSELAERDEAPVPDIVPSDPAVVAAAVAQPAEPIETLELEELDALDEGEYDGPRLRRARLRNGVELDQIAGVTKVSPTYLRFVEEERFDDLPAAVYVRGFVMGYASCVGLDPGRVAKSYMRRCEEIRDSPKAKRLSRK